MCICIFWICRFIKPTLYMGTYVTKWKACQTNLLSKDNHELNSTQQSSKFEAYLSQSSNFLPYNNYHPLKQKQNKKIQKQNQEKSKQNPSYQECFCIIHILLYQILSVQDQCLKCSLFNYFNHLNLLLWTYMYQAIIYYHSKDMKPN